MFENGAAFPADFVMMQSGSPTTPLTGHSFAAGELQLSKSSVVSGALVNTGYANALGEVTEQGSGKYTLLVTSVEADVGAAGQGTITLRINAAGAVSEQALTFQIVASPIGSLIAAERTSIAAAVAAPSASTIAAAVAAPSASTIAAAVAAAVPTAIQTAAAVLAAVIDDDITVGGAVQRVHSLLTGKVTGLKAALATVYRRDGSTVSFTAAQDTAAGTRDGGAIPGGTE